MRLFNRGNLLCHEGAEGRGLHEMTAAVQLLRCESGGVKIHLCCLDSHPPEASGFGGEIEVGLVRSLGRSDSNPLEVCGFLSETEGVAVWLHLQQLPLRLA